MFQNLDHDDINNVVTLFSFIPQNDADGEPGSTCQKTRTSRCDPTQRCKERSLRHHCLWRAY